MRQASNIRPAAKCSLKITSAHCQGYVISPIDVHLHRIQLYSRSILDYMFIRSTIRYAFKEISCTSSLYPLPIPPPQPPITAGICILHLLASNRGLAIRSLLHYDWWLESEHATTGGQFYKEKERAHQEFPISRSSYYCRTVPIPSNGYILHLLSNRILGPK